MAFTDLYRLGNLALAVLAVIFGLYTARRRWRTWNARTRVGVEALLAFAVANIVGAVENIAQGNSYGIRTVLVSVALVWTNLALYPFRRARDDTPWR